MAKNEDNWIASFEALKAYVTITGHVPDKHSCGDNTKVKSAEVQVNLTQKEKEEEAKSIINRGNFE